MARQSYAMTMRMAFVLSVSTLLLLASDVEAAGDVLIAQRRGPGGYFSPIKLGLIAIVFFVWVRFADWINRDTIQIGDLFGQMPQIWNPINVGVHLLGFLAAITIPIFWVGYAIYVLSSVLPWLIYRLMRRSAIKKDTAIKQRLNPEKGLEMGSLQQDEGVELNFTPAGETDSQRQGNLIKARQSSGFVPLKDLLVECMLKRAETLLIDYSQTQATSRILVDGAWHPLLPMDREAGDTILFSLKCLSGLNPADRRSKQSGRFNAKSPVYGKRTIDIITQGVPSGERVQLKLIGDAASKLPLKQLGMLPTLEKPFSQALNRPGVCIVSAPKAQGLTTSWQGMLLSADRLTRDCVGFVSKTLEEETAIENIVIKHYQAAHGGQSNQAETLAAALLTRPDSIAVPHVETHEAMDHLTAAVKSQDLSVWLQASAKSSVEALMMHFKKAGNRARFAETVQFVTNQRLARRLCDTCKQEIRVQPKVIQQLGGDPKKQGTIYQAYRLPPPEQRVDENGKPIEFPPCETCGGLGHIGRIAIYELLTINDDIRHALVETPKAAAIEAVVKQSKAKIPMTASAWKLVLLGVISLQEAQAALKK